MDFLHNLTQLKPPSYIKNKVKVNPTEANTLALVKAEKALQKSLSKNLR